MKYKVYDIHSHVVPAIDDGASNLDMAIEILRLAYAQGTRGIVCTSHSGYNTERYKKNLKMLQERVKKENIEINLYPGCEIDGSSYLSQEIVEKLNANKFLTINGTKYVLVEFSPFAPANIIVYSIQQIIESGYNVILAHAERHLGLSNQYDSVAKLKKLGCLLQVNAYSLYEERNVAIKLLAMSLLKDKHVDFIGSDVHRTDHRTYTIENGINYIYENCDEEYAKDICYRNAEKLLNIR